jgi:hypothetical protein
MQNSRSARILMAIVAGIIILGLVLSSFMYPVSL